MRLRELRPKELIERLNAGTNLTLMESIMVPEVGKAFKDWTKNAPGKWLLIGGLVVGLYTRPRSTIDVDVLFADETDIPSRVPGFKRHRAHAFQHNDTHVEIETLTPKTINLPEKLFQQIYDTAVETQGVHIPSPAGMIALKVMRGDFQDIADINAIKKAHPETSIAGFDIDLQKLHKAEQTLGYSLT